MAGTIMGAHRSQVLPDSYARKLLTLGFAEFDEDEDIVLLYDDVELEGWRLIEQWTNEGIDWERD